MKKRPLLIVLLTLGGIGICYGDALEANRAFVDSLRDGFLSYQRNSYSIDLTLGAIQSSREPEYRVNEAETCGFVAGVWKCVTPAVIRVLLSPTTLGTGDTGTAIDSSSTRSYLSEIIERGDGSGGGDESWDAPDSTRTDTSSTDPEKAFFIREAKFDGMNIHDQLIAAAEQQALFREFLPDLWGGTEYIASDSFFAEALDVNLQPVSGFQFGSAVLRTATEGEFLALILHSPEFSPINQFDHWSFSLDPVVSGPGALSLQVKELFAMPRPVPEPKYVVGLLVCLFGYIIRRRTD